MISGFGGSSIDILLESYRQLEEEPIRKLEGRKSNINNRMGLFNDLKSKLSSFNSLVKEFGYSGTTSIFGVKAATSSDETIATVTASSTAVATSHTLLVTQLAKADKIVSNQSTLANSDLASTIGSGTHTFDVTVNGTTSQVSVTIDSADTNQGVMDKVVSAVNNSTGLGIRASVIKDTSTTGRLIFTSEETGADNAMTLSDISGSLLQNLGISDSTKASGTSGGYLYEDTELNAVALVDGISVQSNSNTLEDVVSGLTITLKDVPADPVTATPITINVANDVDKIKEKVQSFIDSYNEIIDFIKTNTSVNTATFNRSPFSGDFSITNFRLSLRNIIAEPVSGLPTGDPTVLSSLGIESGRDGKLSIKDATKLEDMIKSNLGQVEQIFNSTNGLSSKLETLIDTMNGGEGILQKRRDVLQSQINGINQRIERKRTSVDKRLEYYRIQFSQLQAAFAQFSSQSNIISTLSQSSF